MAYNSEALSMPYVGWKDVEESPEFSQLTGPQKIKTLQDWGKYSLDYTQRQLDEAPEEEKPKFQNLLEQRQQWVESGLQKYNEEYSLGGQINKLGGDLDATRSLLSNPQALMEQGFEPEEISAARKAVFEENKDLFRAAVRAQNAAGTAFDLVTGRPQDQTQSLVEAVGSLGQSVVNDLNQGLDDATLEEKFYTEPGVADMVKSQAARTATAALSVTMRWLSGLSDLTDRFQRLNESAYNDEAWTRDSALRSFSETTGETAKTIDKTAPLDPRIGENTAAFMEGAAQMPGQIAPWLVPGVGTALGVATSAGQVYQEGLEQLNEDYLWDAYKTEEELGTLLPGQDFEKWKKTLSDAERDEIKGMAAGHAMVAALPNAAMDIFSDKLLVGKLATPGLRMFGTTIANLRRSAPTVAKGALFTAKAGVNMAVEGGTETLQGANLDLNSALVRQDFAGGRRDPSLNDPEARPLSLAGKAFSNWKYNFLAGMGGAAVVTPMTAAQVGQEQASWESARSMVEENGPVYEEASRALDALKNTVGEGSAVYARYEKGFRAQQDEAHWTLWKLGDPAADQTRAEKVEARRKAGDDFQTSFAQYLSTTGASYEDNRSIGSALKNRLDQIGETYTRLRESYRAGGFTQAAKALEAAERTAKERAQKDAIERQKEAQRALDKFVGSSAKPGQGRAVYGRAVVAQMFPDFAYSEDYKNDDVVVSVLDAIEGGALREGDNVQDWLNGAAQTPQTPSSAAPSSAPVEATNLNQGVPNNGQQENQAPQGQEPRAATAVPAASGTQQGAGTGVAPGDGGGATSPAPAPAPEPEITIKQPEGTEVRMTRTGFLQAYNSLYDEVLGLGNLTPENVGNVITGARALEQIVDEAPELSPEQKAEWKKPVEGLRGYLEGEQAKLKPGESVEVRSQEQAQDTPAAPVQGPATSLDQAIADQTPVNLGSQVGVLTRDPETGRPVFKADNGTEIELRVSEAAAAKAPEALLPTDLGTETDTITPVSVGGKRFSVLPQRETAPARPVFVRNEQPQGGETNNELRQETQSNEGQTSQAQEVNPPAPQPAVDTAVIEAAVKSIPDAHQKTDGRRKLISREAAVVLMDRINKEAAANDGKITRKRVLELGRQLSATNPQALALAELAQSPEALANAMRGDYDNALGLFDRNAAADTETDTDTDTETDTKTPSAVTPGQTANERWVNDAFAALEAAVNALPNSAKNRSIKQQMASEEGRAEIQRKLGGIYSVSLDGSLRANGVLDPVVREETLERILRGVDSQTQPGTLTRNVLGDLQSNLQETGDPFTVQTKDGKSAPYSARAVYRRELAPAIQAQNRRDREMPDNNEGGTTEDDRKLGRGTNLDTDPERSAAKSELAQMKIDATREATEEVADELAAELAIDGTDARLALAKILQDTFPGLGVDAVSMGWRSPNEKTRAKQTVLRELRGREREVVERLVTRLRGRLESVTQFAREQGLLGSEAVVQMDDVSLADILTRQLAAESELGEAQAATKEAREKNSMAPLEPLLAKIANSEVLSATVARAVALTSLDGRVTTNSQELGSLTPEDMRRVLDSPYLPDSLREVLRAAMEIGKGDPLSYVTQNGPEWAKMLAGLIQEQNAKHPQGRRELFWNLGLVPKLGTAQGLWAGDERAQVSLFLDPETRAATAIHEAMHGVWDWKIRAYLKDAGTTLLNSTERAALDDLVGLKSFVEAAAQQRIAEAEARGDSPEAIARMRRDLLGGFSNSQINLQEFLNEAINHKPFQDFLAELTDPNAKDKTSIWRKVVNAILRLMRGNDVALDSALQRAFELSLDLAKDTREAGLDIRSRNSLQIEFFRDNEARLGRPMTPEEIELASRMFDMAYPKAAIAATESEAMESAPDALTPAELNAYNNYLQVRESAAVLSASQENIPGSESGLLAKLAKAPYAVKEDYHNQTNAALIDPETGRDTVAEILGMPDPTVLVRGPSVYSPKKGVVEFNPADILTGFRSAEDATRYMLLRGAFTNQNAIGGLDPKTSGKKAAALFDVGRVPTETEIQQIYGALKKPDDTAIYLNDRGLSIVKLGFDDNHNDATWQDSINAVQTLLNSQADPFQTDTIYHENEYDKRTNPADDPYGLKSQTAAARLSLSQAVASRPLDIQARAADRLRARLTAVDQRFARQGYGKAEARENQLLSDLRLFLTLDDFLKAVGRITTQEEFNARFNGRAANFDPTLKFTLGELLESAATNENSYYENLTHKGTDPLTGGRTGIGKYRRGYSPSPGNEGTPTRGSDFPDAVRRRNQGTHSRIEAVRRAINETNGGVSRQEQGHELVKLLIGRSVAPEGSALAEAIEELRAEIPVVPVSALKGLKQIDEGMSSKVFADAKNGAIYKLVTVKDGKVGGTFPRDIRVRPEDGAVMVTGSRTIDLMDAIDAVIIGNKQGSAVFTEVAAITEDGRIILKQPYVKGLREIEMFEDGSSDISQDLRSAIEELGMEIISEMGSPVAVGRVGTRWAIFDDLHGNNVMRNAQGRAVFVDALATRLLSPGEVELLRPYIKSEQNRGETLESAPTQQDAFYSKLVRVLETKMPNTASAQQVKAIIDPARGSGVKPEEVKWSGVEQAIDQFAADNNGKVPKDALLKYLAEDGAVRLEEVTLDKDFDRLKSELETAANDYGYRIEVAPEDGEFWAVAPNGDWESVEYGISNEALDQELEIILNNYGDLQGSPAYSSYQLPGGDNYRIKVLVMPEPTDTKGANESYRSGHFPKVPNYVAHMRLNERVDAKGKRGLFIEEIQSDRHQSGRDAGYIGDTLPLPQGYRVEKSPIRGFIAFTPEGESLGGRDTITEATQSARMHAGLSTGKAQVPDAPFRKDWPLQMFKRALRDAVASGQEWIGWTTGETQADRYDLSDQLDSVEVRKIEGSDRVAVYGSKNNENIIARQSTMATLADVIGKELAGKAAADLVKSTSVTYRGVDLKVGGEGMAGFYDNILPKEIGKYVKQWGGLVEKSVIQIAPERLVESALNIPGDPAANEPVTLPAENTSIWRVNITPQMRDGVLQGQPLMSAPTQQEPFDNSNDVKEYVRRKFVRTATALKTDLFPNIGGYTAKYVVESSQGGHMIEYNPRELVGMTPAQVDAIMREELIHAASGLVLQRKNMDWVDFYTDLAKSMSKPQKMALKKVYVSARKDYEIGAEYFRVSIQKLLYGTITEAEMKETAMQKIIALLKEVVAYFNSRKMQPEVREVYDATVAMLRKADAKNLAKPGRVLESAAISYQKAEGQVFRSIANDFVAEAPRGPLLAENDEKAAREALRTVVLNPSRSQALPARGGRKVNLASPDDATARKLAKATGRRWDNESALLEARIIHALTESNRTTVNADKVRTAALVPETLRNADVVTEFTMTTEDEGRVPFVAFSKLYQDPESPTGQRWHTVEVRKNRMVFETQYSAPKLGSRVADSRVVGLGDSTPKKKTLAGAGRGSELTPGVETGARTSTLPDVSPNQGQVNIDSTTGENVQNNFELALNLEAEADRLVQKAEIAANSGNYTEAGRLQKQADEKRAQMEILAARESAPVVQVGFEPLTFGPDSRKVTQALARVRGEAEYAAIERALGQKTYIAWNETDTQRKAEEFLDVYGDDLQRAFIAAENAAGVPYEQVIAIKALAVKRAQEAANAARLEAEKLPAQISGVSDEAVKNKLYNKLGALRLLNEHYQGMAMSFTESLMEKASAAGSELRAFRLLADIMAPASWVRHYKAAIVKTQTKRLSNDKLAQRIGTELNAARTKAANRTADRMKKALALFAKRFVPEDATPAEIEAAEKLAVELVSPLPVRDAVVQAAVEDTVVQGIETLRRVLSPEQQADPSFLEAWEQRLRKIAAEQINAAIESRAQGGRVDAPAPGKTEAELKAEEEARLADTWRSLADLPIAELVFNLAKEEMAQAGGPLASLLDTAKFSAERSSQLRKAVRLSVHVPDEIRKTAAERSVTIEELRDRLSRFNPELSGADMDNLLAAVEQVYNTEVNEAAQAALARIVKNSTDPRAKRVLSRKTIEDLLPLVNMGAFSTEAAYNAIADKFDLPTWDPAVAKDIEQKAVALQALPEGSLQRQEAAQTLQLEVAKANIKASRGKARFQHYNQMASSLWTSLILSAPPTQIVNAGMSAVSVLMESLFDASGYYANAVRGGASHQQAAQFFVDAMRAWKFAAGKDATNVSRRAIEEAYRALTKGTQKFKASKYEELSAFEMFKFDESVGQPGNAMMEAIMSGEWMEAVKQGGKATAGLGVGGAATILLGPLALPISVAENAVRGVAGQRNRQDALRSYMATVRMVGRMMLAADAMNSTAAAASKQIMMKRALLLEDPNLTEAQVEQQMKEIIDGGAAEAKENALLIAETEADRGDFGPKGTMEHKLAKARRVEQLIEQETYGPEVLDNARDFAGMATFNGEPYGAVGATMMMVFGGLNRMLGIVAKPFNPFPRTVSNLLNNAINYMPIAGQLRAEGLNFSTKFLDESSKYYKAPPERGSAEYFAQHSRAAFGTVAMTLLALMLKSSWDERERGGVPLFEIHANGPTDINKRRQWQAAGGKPFTVRFKNIQLRYTDWPALNIVLGALGTVYDEAAFGDTDADVTDRLFNALVSVAGVTLNRNMLGGASALFDVLSSGTPGQVKQAALNKLAGSYVGGFTKPALTRYLETIATGTYGENRTMAGFIASQIPLMGPIRNKPSLNILGEPIEINPVDATVGRLANLQKTHPILTPLSEANLWIRPPQRYRIADPERESGSRQMNSEEFYRYSEYYGKEMSARLNEGQVSSLVALSKTNPQLAQDRLDQIATFSRNAAQQMMRLQKAKRK